MNTLEVIEEAFHRALSFTMDADDPGISLALTGLLVDAGLVTDHEIGHRSVEARILKAFRDVQDSWEGEWHHHADLVAERIASRLGIAGEVAA